MNAKSTVSGIMDYGQRVKQARSTLEGLSIGDAFGELFLQSRANAETRSLPSGPWPFTDDTVMALSVFEILDECGGIDSDRLAQRFADRYREDPQRGYGGMAQVILQAIASDLPWELVAQAAFRGQGSMGNGGAMRVGPVGAYFADDLDTAVEHAYYSARVTHAHREGQAGAMAVAVAVALAHRLRGEPQDRVRQTFFEGILDYTPKGPTRAGLVKASRLERHASIEEAVRILGNGSRVTAPDTVPFTIWCAVHHLTDYDEALWTTASGRGDCDTNCAIVGSIVAAHVGIEGIPPEWLESREPLEIGNRR